MKWLRASTLVGLGLSLSLFAGCGDSASGTPDGGPGGDFGNNTLPDGFLTTGCMVAGDCDDSDLCTIDTCNTDHQCMHGPIDCSSSTDMCNEGVCDSQTGLCGPKPTNESKACTTGGGEPGLCMSGSCTPAPTCDTIGYPDCSTTNEQDTTDSGSVTNQVDTYANCGANGLTGYDGPEVAYEFQIFSERQVTINLNATADLDLIVLEDNCVSTAVCTAFSATTGTGAESVTFLAKAGAVYKVVVDGKGGAKGSFTLTFDCPRICNSPKTIACNTGTVSGDTSMSSAMNINTSDCGGMDPGPEDVYVISPTASQQDYKLTLKGLTQDLDMSVFYDMGSGQSLDCDTGFCKKSNIMSGLNDEDLTFTGYKGNNYFVVVDSKSVGGAYQLEVNCPLSCANTSSFFNYLSCSFPGDLRRNDDMDASNNTINSWGPSNAPCATNTTGPEVVYQFQPDDSGQYTVSLSDLSADLDLIVVESPSSSTCDPATACQANVQTGTTNESVTFTADKTKTYWIAVDGHAGAVSSYALTLRSALCTASLECDAASLVPTLSCTWREDSRRNDDPKRGTVYVDTWGPVGSACDTGTTGPEVVYSFVPDTAGSYTVTLDGVDAGKNLDLIVSTSSSYCDSGNACQAPMKAAGVNESVTFNADTSHVYYIAVDGKAGDVSKYHISLTGSMCGAPVCQDGFDSVSCATGARSTDNSNDAAGATNDVSNWQCTVTAKKNHLTGPEFAHHFVPTVTGDYSVSLLSLNADLDLMVLAGDSNGDCAAAATCISSSQNTGTTGESLTFHAEANKDYYLVVDGLDGAISSYTLVLGGCP